MRRNLSHPELAATIPLLALVALCVRPVLAQSTPANQLQLSLSRARLTDDWGGTRTRIENLGVEPRAEFLMESAANPIGGQAQAARYTQEIDFGADLDLNRLVALPNGKVQITFTDDTGHSLSNDAIGGQFQVQELFVANQSFRLSELNYQQDFFTDKIIGRSWLGVDRRQLRATNDILRFSERGVLRTRERDERSIAAPIIFPWLSGTPT